MLVNWPLVHNSFSTLNTPSDVQHDTAQRRSWRFRSSELRTHSIQTHFPLCGLLVQLSLIWLNASAGLSSTLALSRAICMFDFVPTPAISLSIPSRPQRNSMGRSILRFESRTRNALRCHGHGVSPIQHSRHARRSGLDTVEHIHQSSCDAHPSRYQPLQALLAKYC